MFNLIFRNAKLKGHSDCSCIGFGAIAEQTLPILKDTGSNPPKINLYQKQNFLLTIEQK